MAHDDRLSYGGVGSFIGVGPGCQLPSIDGPLRSSNLSLHGDDSSQGESWRSDGCKRHDKVLYDQQVPV